MFRKVRAEDFPQIDYWISLDSDHIKKGMTHEFFTVNVCFVVEDELGPVMYIRLDPELPISMRVHIQFEAGNESRTARAFIKGFPKVQEEIYKTGARRMVFDSVSPKLTAFCERMFGYTRVGETDDYELMLGETCEMEK